MLDKIIAFSIRNKLIIGLLTIVLILFGVYQTSRLPIDAVPDITNNQVQIITVAPSFGATDIERLVTFPIEQASSNINGIQEIRSFSRFGLSLVTIVFNDATDIYWARQQVAERLQKVQADIPAGIGRPELGPITTGLGEIYQYVVRPKKGYEGKYNETDLRTIQDWIVRRQLLGVKGVAEVSSFGGKLKQNEIAVNTARLHAMNLTMQDVFNALEQNNQNTGGAYIEKGPTALFIRSEGLVGSREDIESIPVKSTAGVPILIKDIAAVNIGHATRYGAMTYNDKGEVAGAVVMMLKGANSSKVVKAVKARIAEIQKTLPEGVVVEPFLDRTKMVNNAIGTVEKNLIEGALIVVFILVLFLGNFRAGLLVASVIPLAMLFAIIMMNLFGVSGNLMSLGALDFGLIVDGAVIIVEAVMHQLAHSKRFAHINRLSQTTMDSEVKQSASKMMNSAVFGQIIILIVYLPIFSLQGIEGKMFKPMAQTVAFALAGAFLLSLTYIPMMSALVLSKKLKHRPSFSDRMMFRLERGYQHSLARVLRFPKTVLAIVAGLFIAAVITLGTLGGEFIPALEEGDFAVDTRVLTGSNLNTTIQYSQKAAHILKTRFPEVEKVVTKIGSGEVPTDPMPMEASDMMVVLKDKKEWTSAHSFPELADKMSKALEEIPGISTGFQFPVQMRFNELMTGARQDVVCKVFGEDLDTLAQMAGRLGSIISTVKGAEDLYIEPVTGMPQIVISYNRAAIAQYGLNIADINRVINTAFAGQSTGMVFEGEKRFELVVRLDASQRSSLEDIRNLLIPTPSGVQIPLQQLATIDIRNGPNQIQREDTRRRIVVGFNVRGRDVQSIVKELQEKVAQTLKVPAGYSIRYGGAFENLEAAKQRLMIAVPVSLVLIFLLLFFAFNSIRQGLLIYTAIPLSAIGGIFLLALRGMPFSISAGVGFIALFGVAVLNGIVLIAEFNRLKQKGLKSLHRIVLMGTKVRLRPVLMTACVASLGFLPMAVSNGAGAEVQRPLATVVIGGLLLATFLTLFVLPIFYILFERKAKVKSGSRLKEVAAAMLLFSLILANVDTKAQSISLNAAIDSALKNSLTVKRADLLIKYREQLKGGYATLPQTMLNVEAGQINSAYTDNRLGIVQSFAFPSVYGAQKKVLEAEWNAAVLSRALNKAELRRRVTELFYHHLLLREEEHILLSTDSVYAAFVQKASLRFNKGESNVAEKSSAEAQRSNIWLQLKSLQNEIALNIIRLQLLMNTDTAYEPASSSLKMSPVEIPDSAGLADHPALKIYQQQLAIAGTSLKLERAKLLPEISLGYYNQSIRGMGADEKLYATSDRFHAAQAGIGIPIFSRTQRANIRAAKTQLSLTEATYQFQSKELQSEWAEAWASYRSSLEMVNHIEASLLPNAAVIIQTAERQFNAGAINYLEWTMLNNQAIQIRRDYIAALSRLNEAAIKINYLAQHE